MHEGRKVFAWNHINRCVIWHERTKIQVPVFLLLTNICNAWRQLWHSIVCLGVSLVFLFPFFLLLLWNVFSIFFLSALFNNPLVLLKMCKSTIEVRVLPSGWFSSRNLIYVVSWFTYSQVFPAHRQQASPTHDEAHSKSRNRGNVQVLWLCLLWSGCTVISLQKQKFTLYVFPPPVKPNQSFRFMFIKVSVILLSPSKMQPSLSSRRQLMRESLLWHATYILTSSVFA